MWKISIFLFLCRDHTKRIYNFLYVLECINGWTQFGEFCYLFHKKDRKTWKDASHICKTIHGGHLVSISNQEENDFIKSKWLFSW